MNTHTPGPWRVHDVHPDKWTRQVWTDESHGSVMIATTAGMDKDANAALIAAAPELLVAAEALLKHAEKEECFGGCDHADALRAAIDKARAAIQ